MLNTISQLLNSIINISATKFTPYIFHLKLLHMAKQIIILSLVTSTIKALMRVIYIVVCEPPEC